MISHDTPQEATILQIKHQECLFMEVHDTPALAMSKTKRAIYGKTHATKRNKRLEDQISYILECLEKKGPCIVVLEEDSLLYCSMNSRNTERYLAKPTCMGVYDAAATYWDIKRDLEEISQIRYE